MFIENGVFGDNPVLSEIEVSKENQNFCSIDRCLYDINVTKLYCVPPLVNNLQIPVTVETLIERSISTSKAVLWLPTSVTHIESSAFFRTKNVRQVHILGNLKNVSTQIFYDQLQIDIFYHGQTTVSQPNVVSSSTKARAYICQQYQGTTFSNLPTTMFGSCYSMSLIQTKNPAYFFPFKLFVSIIIPFC